jgi:hypothetical protein
MGIDLSVGIISGIACIIILLNGLLKYRQWKHYRQSFRYFWIGLSILLTVTIFNSLAEDRWDSNYIISFLSIKIVGPWLFRVVASYCYISIAMGLEVLAIVKFNKYGSQNQ